MKRIVIKSRPAHLAVFSLVLVSLTSFNTAIKKVRVSVTPRDHTKVNGYVCGVDTTIDQDRMVAEKNSAFIFDLMGRTRNNPQMGPEYQAFIFDVAFYEDDPAKSVRFSLPTIGRYDVVVLFLLPANAQCNQLTFKNAADRSDLYLPVYIGSSAIQEEVISEYLNLEPGIKNHFGTKMPKLCGVKMFMGHPLVAVSRSEAISFLFNFAFNTKRQLRIDTKTLCTTKDKTEGSLQMSKKIDTTASFSFLSSKKNVDDRNVFLKSELGKKKSGQISVIYVEPVFEAEPGQQRAKASDIVDHSWPVVFNKASTKASFFLLIKDDDDKNQFMKLRFRHVNWVQSLHGDNNQVVEINSDAKAQLDFKPAHGKLKVYTIPVGQGDSTLIQCPNGAISIIDMGCLGGCTMYGWEGYSKQMNTFFPTGDYSKLKHVFFTHPDADHINYALTTENGKPSGGFLHKIRNSKVKAEIHFGEEAGWQKKKWFTKFFSLNQQAYKVVFHEKHGKEHPFTWQDINICGTNDWFIKIIASDLGTGPNERSMVMSLQLKSNQKVQKKMLLMGDFQGDPEYKRLNNYVKLYQGHEVFMVPHHGADTSGNANDIFFNLVFDGHDERHLIVSSALWSTHNHPRGYLLMAACEKPQDDFLDQSDNGANANKNTIMGWFPRFKEVLLQKAAQTKYTKYVDSKYANTIAFSYDCNGHGLYQTTKVDFKTSKKMAFTYQTTFTDNPTGTAVNSQKAKMNATLVQDKASLDWSYSGKILHL